MSTREKAEAYEARGSVRGSCGHKHRTIGAAHACAEKDRRDCAGLPGGNAYSDREVCRVDGAELDRSERAELEGAEVDS